MMQGKTRDGIAIRQASEAEFAVAVDWAAAEGWNPGLADLPAFYAVDPGGFWMAFDGDAPVASISVVRYGPSFGFLGFYITRPDWRGRGVGFQLWQAGLAHLGARAVGLDGVVAQQENYRRSGFALAGRNIRFAGQRPAGEGLAGEGLAGEGLAGEGPSGLTPIAPALAERAAAFDAPLFPGPRQDFARRWASSGSQDRRHGLMALRDGAVAGYGVIRACREGYKLGPLYAEDPGTAETLFRGLAASTPENTTLYLDAPEANAEAVALAERFGFTPSFETARMYRGTAPNLPWARIYGVTSFELG